MWLQCLIIKLKTAFLIIALNTRSNNKAQTCGCSCIAAFYMSAEANTSVPRWSLQVI